MKKKILIAIIILIILIIGFVIVFGSSVGEDGEWPVVVSNFVDPLRIQAISKFRSCQGHVVVPQDQRETKRNMKHYFYLKKEHTTESKMVELYAPFDGYVTDFFGFKFGNEGREKDSIDMTIAQSKKRGAWSFIFLHIIPKEGLKEGDEVKAGELVGYSALDVPPLYSFDVIYGRMGTFPRRVDGWMAPYASLDSVFNHMTDKVLEEYKVLGVDSKDDFINSKEYRDQNPCEYEGNGPRFKPGRNEETQKNDWIGSVWDY